MDIKFVHNNMGRLVASQKSTLFVYALFALSCLLPVSVHAETYRLIADHYLDIGNRWEYEIHVTEDLYLGSGDWSGTQEQRVTASQTIKGRSTRLVETTEAISGIGTSWIDENYELTPHCLSNTRSETADTVYIFKDSPFEEAPVWVSEFDYRRYIGSGNYGIEEDPNSLWEVNLDTFVTFEQTDTITVPAGTFNCIVVTIEIGFEENDHIFETDDFYGFEEITAWIDPNIGIIQAGEYTWMSVPDEGIFISASSKVLTSTNLLPSKVTDPSPKNGAVKRSVNIDISWSASPKALSYNVYFGECGNMEFVGNQLGTIYDPGELLSCTTYCWQIDPVNENGVITGDEWSFTTGSNVPDIRGLTEAEAETILNSVSLTKGAVAYDYSSTVPADSVMDQNPDDGTTAECGSSVDIVISIGPWPDVNGDTLVNFTDYSIVADRWMRNDCNAVNQWCDGADLFQTGHVDAEDLGALCNGWLTNPGLVAFWPMDDNASNNYVEDISGFGNEGQSQVNTEILSVAGVIDTALSFNGIDDFIQISNSDSLDIHGTDAELTICGWFRFDRLDKPHALIWKTEGSSRQYFLNVNTSKELIFRVFKNDSTDSKAEYELDNSLIDDWVFIAGVFDGQRSRLYLNGNKVGSTGDSINQIRSTNGNVVIGNQDGLTSTHFYSGTMDNVMIFDRALSEQEIQNLSQGPI